MLVIFEVETQAFVALVTLAIHKIPINLFQAAYLTLLTG